VPVGTYLDFHSLLARPWQGDPAAVEAARQLPGRGLIVRRGELLAAVTIRKPHRASRTSQRPNRRQ
jgi:hypothetical protein